MAVGLLTFTTSCKEALDAILSTCNCTWEADGTEITTVENLDEYDGISSCSELERALERADDGYFDSIECI